MKHLLVGLILGMLCCQNSAYRHRLVGAPEAVTIDEVATGIGYETGNRLLQHLSSTNDCFEPQNFLCATEKVVSGMMYVIYSEGISCGNEHTCSANEMNLCSTTIIAKLWKKSSDRIEFFPQQCSCRDATYSPCGGNVGSRPKRDLDLSLTVDINGGESPVMSMEKQPKAAYQYDPEVKTLFNQFIAKYGKTYSEAQNSATYQERYEIFKKNLQLVEILNKMEEGSAVYGITKFMDYSEEEYRKYLAPGFTESKVDIEPADVSDLDLENIPDSFDWRKKGAVTAVKNQGQCGSCWAFSTTGNVEGQWFLKHGKLWSLSEQELVDCDTLDHGCNGGLPSNAYKSIEELGGLETESDYPYDAEGEQCHINKKDFKVYVNSSVSLSKDETVLAAWLAQNGPISIGINANMMQFYFGGISHPWKIFCNPHSLDHGVLIVGYGTENGEPFWIIKNSWGPNWGEEGYYRIYRGDGSCGVNQMATSAVID